MTTIINGSSPSVTFSDGTTQSTSAIVSGYVPYANLPAGSVLQVIQVANTVTSSTSSTSYVSSGYSASITPKFATSKILVMVNGGKNYSPVNAITLCEMYRNGSGLGAVARWVPSEAGSGITGNNHSFCYLDSPATTSSTTYTPYYRNSGSAGTVYFSDGPTSVGPVYITLMEIAA